MVWSKLDDQLDENPKVLSFSDRAFRLWIYSITSSSRRETHGALSPDHVRTLLAKAGASSRHAEELVARGGWERTGCGFQVHDYISYNPADPTGATRQARWRSRNAQSNAENNGPDRHIKRDADRYDAVSPVPVPGGALSLTEPTKLGEEKLQPEDLRRIWNENRGGMIECRALTRKRSQAAAARLRETPEFARWAAAIQRAAKSRFCAGAGQRGWKADFEWLLRPDTLLRIEEGRFDDGRRGGAGPAGHHIPGRYSAL